jgi:hypothetical protein
LTDQSVYRRPRGEPAQRRAFDLAWRRHTDRRRRPEDGRRIRDDLDLTRDDPEQRLAIDDDRVTPETAAFSLSF